MVNGPWTGEGIGVAVTSKAIRAMAENIAENKDFFIF
jgi:hypothetical protein